MGRRYMDENEIENYKKEEDAAIQNLQSARDALQTTIEYNQKHRLFLTTKENRDIFVLVLGDISKSAKALQKMIKKSTVILK